MSSVAIEEAVEGLGGEIGGSLGEDGRQVADASRVGGEEVLGPAEK